MTEDKKADNQAKEPTSGPNLHVVESNGNQGVGDEDKRGAGKSRNGDENGAEEEEKEEKMAEEDELSQLLRGLLASGMTAKTIENVIKTGNKEKNAKQRGLSLGRGRGRGKGRGKDK
jgi:hypothetical protein